MFKKLKLVFFLIPFLVCGSFWFNSSVPISLSTRPFDHIGSEVYKTDDQRIAIFQKNWKNDPKKHYFARASIFGVETVALDSAGASYAYAETLYKPSQTPPNSFHYLMNAKEFLKKNYENKLSNLKVPKWIDKKLNKSTYKVWLNSSNIGELANFWYKSNSFGKVIYKGTQNFVVIYKITDFISEIRKIVKTKNKDLSTSDIDFTQLQGKARKQLLAILDGNGNLRSGIWDSIETQIKNGLGQDYFNSHWKATKDLPEQSDLQSIRDLLLKIQDLGISKVSHPFFPEGYDLSFLKDNERWKQISFQDLLQGMKVVVNETNVEFYSHLFPDKIIFQVPMKDLSTVFSGITVANIIKSLEKTINDHTQQEKKLATKKGLTIGLSVAGGVLFLSALSGSLYWFFKIKK